MVSWLVKKAERVNTETVVRAGWVEPAVGEAGPLRSSKLTKRKLTARLNGLFKSKSKSWSNSKSKSKPKSESSAPRASRKDCEIAEGQWVRVYRYIRQNYKDNWVKSIVTLIIVTITLHYILHVIILFMEQTRKTMVSFYKWQFLSNFMAPSGTNIIGSLSNITAWFQIVKNIVMALIQ